MADVGFKLKQHLNDIHADPLDSARALTTFGKLKVACFDACLLDQDQACNIVDAFNRCNGPGEGKQVAPVTVGVKQGSNARLVVACQSSAKLIQPVVCKSVVWGVRRGNDWWFTKVHK